MLTTSIPPAVDGFLEQVYRYKSVSMWIPHDPVLASICPTGDRTPNPFRGDMVGTSNFPAIFGILDQVYRYKSVVILIPRDDVLVQISPTGIRTRYYFRANKAVRTSSLPAIVQFLD